MKPKHPDKYNQILAALKDKIRNARLQAVLSVNTQMLKMYWEIGDAIAQQQKEEGWGAKVIDNLANDLRSEFKDMKGLAPRNLRYMRDFALAYPGFSTIQETFTRLSESEQKAIWQPVVAKLDPSVKKEKKKAATKTEKAIWQPAVAKIEPTERAALLAGQITWTHNIVLLNKLPNTDARIFYAEKTIQNGWGRRVLEMQIESKLHERTGKALNNFENTLPAPQSDLARESFRNPYVFDFLAMGEEMQERELEKALIAHIKQFMLELGKGFAYVGNQYHLEVVDNDYFLDLLFFNIQLNCYVIFELKVGDFEPEFTGKLNFYINTVDEKIKTAAHNPTIGILLCKTPNKTVVEYALRGMQNPLGVADYELSKALPKKLKSDLPTVEELEKEMEKSYEELLTPADKKLKRIKEIIGQLKTDVIKETKNAKNCKVILEKVIIPLKGNLERGLAEVALEFKEARWTIWIDSLSFIDDAGAIEEFKKKKVPDSITIELRLNGFKKGGVRAFNLWGDLHIELQQFHYRITKRRHDNEAIIEKVYHLLPTKAEMKDIEEVFKDTLYDQLEQNLERIRK